MCKQVNIIYNFYGYYKGAMAGSIFDTNGIAPTISTMNGGNREPLIIVDDDRESNTNKKVVENGKFYNDSRKQAEEST